MVDGKGVVQCHGLWEGLEAGSRSDLPRGRLGAAVLRIQCFPAELCVHVCVCARVCMKTGQMEEPTLGVKISSRTHFKLECVSMWGS